VAGETNGKEQDHDQPSDTSQDKPSISGTILVMLTCSYMSVMDFLIFCSCL